MGSEVDAAALGREHRRAHRERLHQCVRALGAMLADHAVDPASSRFESADPRVGMEVELALVDAADPALAPHRGGPQVVPHVNADAGDSAFGPEIGAHTIELNVPPGVLASGGLGALEGELRSRLDAAAARAREHGARLVMTGLLPTLLAEHLSEGWRTPSARYAALEEAVLAARGEDVELDITSPGAPERPGRDPERLSAVMPTIAGEAACTSTQVHLKVAPEAFAASWNAAQLLMGPQVALGANSPFALGRRLWEETRIPLFEQSVDTRTPELVAQGVRPRVFAGDAWARGPLDLFAQDVRLFPALLPQNSAEDPLAVLEDGGVPELAELRLLGGTVWRWNRPVYDASAAPGGVRRAHLRVENRVMPTGPTVADVVADAAVWLGAVLALVAEGPDPAALLPHAAAVEGLRACARRGLAAEVAWPGAGTAPVRRVLLERVLPLAARGLAEAGASGADVDRVLGTAEARASCGRTGAVWQARAVAALEARGADRAGALAGMLARYAEASEAGDPVHTWPDVRGAG